MLASTSPAMAQQVLAIDNEAKQAIDSLKRDNDQKASSEAGDPLAGKLRPAFRIEASARGTDAKLTFSRQREGADGFSPRAFAVTLTAPISKDTERADFLTQSGLPGKLSLGFSFTASRVNLGGIDWNDEKIAGLMYKSDQNCKAANTKPDLDPDKLAEICETKVAFRNRKKLYLSEADKKQLESLYIAPVEVLKQRSLLSFNLAGTLGTEKFKFFDSITLAGQEQRKTGYSLGLSAGWLPHLHSSVFLIGGFEAKRSYTAAKSSTYCPTSGTGPTVKCTVGSFGPPTLEIDRKLIGRIRFTGDVPLGKDEKTPFGIELSGAYDFHDKTWGLEMPVYVFVDKEKGLTGGLRGAYDSKEDDFQLGVFIGKTFNFLEL